MNTALILCLVLGAVLVLCIAAAAVLAIKKHSRRGAQCAGEEKTAEDLSSAQVSSLRETAETSAAAQGTQPPLSGMRRLRARLAVSGAFGRALLGILAKDKLCAQDWEELEETLLMADLGVDATDELLNSLRREMQIQGKDAADARTLLRSELLKLVHTDKSRELNPASGRKEEGAKVPDCVLLVGVNGTGKTTTAGKLARFLISEGKTVVLGAADTFRAAAAQQLRTWGQRVGAQVVSSEKEGVDPASVAFDAVKTGCAAQADAVLVDTAGRLQNKAGLMDELGKIKRVMEKQAPVSEVLLVLDATTGQNGLQQARVFGEVTGLSGIVLTKLDGTAKGGIVIAVQRELGVPVKFVGLGEGPDDLVPFEPEEFVDSLLSK